MKWRGLATKFKPMSLGLTLGALSVSGYLTATGVARLTETATQGPTATQEKPAASPASGRASPLALSQAVLTRNIFDSSVGSMAWEERVEPLGPTPAGPDSDLPDEESGPSPASPITDCPSDLRLTAVFMAEDQARSFGVMQRGSTPAKQVRIGGDLDGVTLLMLAPTLAFVRQTDSSTCRLLLYRSVAPVALAPAAAPAKAAPAKGKVSATKSLFSDGELEAGITPLGGDTYRVSRELITRAMADATSAVQGVRFIPQTGEQRSNGVKVQRLTNKAVLYKLGVRNNDTLRTLNGLDLSSTDGMLSAYALLRQENTISLALMRDGSFKTLTYKLE